MSYSTKVYHEQGGEKIVVQSGGAIQIKTGGKLLPNGGTQASHIADATAATGGDAPTEAEYNAVVTKLNSVLAALRGVGVLASS